MTNDYEYGVNLLYLDKIIIITTYNLQRDADVPEFLRRDLRAGEVGPVLREDH